MKKILIIGTSGSGKTTLASKLSQLLNIPAYELDNLYWLPNWKAIPINLFRKEVDKLSDRDKWIICGNYSSVRDILWGKADTFIWLDYPFYLSFYRALLRSLKRIFIRETCCNGNYETISRTFLSKNSILLWVAKSHWRHKKNYISAFLEKQYRQKSLIRITSPKQLSAWMKLIEIKLL